MTLGLLLGLGMVGCTERNPAYHKPADAGGSPPRDAAASDTSASADHPSNPGKEKDAKLRADTLIETPGDTSVDSPRRADAQGEAGSQSPDTLALDGRADTGGLVDTKPPRDARFDTWVADGAVSPPPDVIPARPDAEQPDGPAITEDAPLQIDAPEADAAGIVDVLPDAEPDVWPDAENAELDSI